MTISQERFSEKMDELDRQNPGPKERLRATAITEAAALLRAEGWTVKELVAQGKIPPIRRGQVWRAPGEPYRKILSATEFGIRCEIPYEGGYIGTHFVGRPGFVLWIKRTGARPVTT